MSFENTTGRRWSDIPMEERFYLAWEQLGFEGADWGSELAFCEGRHWRFDVASPSRMVAIEFDGMGFGHQSIKRLKESYEKRNAACALGWRVMVFDSSVMSIKGMSDIIEIVEQALCWEPGMDSE